MCPLLLCTTYFPHSHSKYLNIPSSISFYNLNSYYPLNQFQKAIRTNLNWTHIVGTHLLILNLCFWSTREKCKTNRRRYKGCLVCRAAKSSIVEHFSIEENLYRILSKSKLKFLVYKHNGGIGGWWWRGWLHDQRGFKQPFCSFAKYSMHSRQHRCTALNEHTHVSSVVLILSQNAVYCQISIALQSPFWADIVPPEWPSFPSNSFIKSDSDEWHNFEIPSSSRHNFFLRIFSLPCPMARLKASHCIASPNGKSFIRSDWKCTALSKVEQQ